MEANQESISISGPVPVGESGGETVEIRIRTLDSQSYALRVEKNITVPALKEQLASIVGVPMENQRLICRGKVLKDDQLLSAYNVEDGHTLHLVARPPSTPGVGSSSLNSENGQRETALPPPGGRSGHVSHSLVMGTINFPDSGEGQLPDLNRILNAVMSSMGMHVGGSLQDGTGNAGNLNSGVVPAPAGAEHEAADGSNSRTDQGIGVRELELQIEALYGMPSSSAGNTGEGPIRGVQAPVVVPDALTTMSQYLDRLEQSLAAEESSRTTTFGDSGRTEVNFTSDMPRSGGDSQRGASPTVLGSLVNRVNTLLGGRAGSALSLLASRLENEPSMVDAPAREELQHEAFHDGHLMQQIGALLLELGRATLSLRMGQAPSESVVNSGPAIFISPSGPNPMIVQALPRQLGAGVAAGAGLPSIPAGLSVRQILERANSRQHAGPAPNDASGSGPPNPSSTDAADGANFSPGNVSSGPTGMQGALVTVDDHGAVRVVPVRSRGAVHLPLGHVHVPSGHVHVDPLVSRFQRQFNFRTASYPPSDTHIPAAINSLPSAFTDSPRQVDQASRTLPGEGGGVVSEFGEASHAANSLAPVLQPFPGTRPLQQPGAPTPPELQSNFESQRPPSTDIVEWSAEDDVGPTDDTQASRESPNGVAAVLALDSRVNSMISDELSRDHERSDSTLHRTPQGRILEAGGSEGSIGGILDASGTAPVGLGLGGFQPLPTRVRRRRQTQQFSLDGQQQPTPRNLANNSDQRSNMPSLDQFVREIGGGDGQQGGPSIIGQLMRSPIVENLFQQVIQGVGDVNGREPSRGGLDLSSMLQHVVPVVTHMLNGGSSAAFPGSTAAGTSARIPSCGAARTTASRVSESENWQDALTPDEVAGWSETMAIDEERQESMPTQRALSDAYRRGIPATKKQKTAVESAAEKLEDGGSAEVVLGDLADAGSAGISGNSGTTSTEDPRQQVVRFDGLAEELALLIHSLGNNPIYMRIRSYENQAYLVVLFNDVAAHVAADPDFGDGSRFPNAARVFLQPSSTPAQPDGK